MERWAGKIAVVTGASSGIGLETAKTLVRHGMIVIGLARRVDKMQIEMNTVKGPGKFYAKGCDVADESKVIQAFQWIEANFKTIHVLINNAGIFMQVTLQDMKTEDLQRTVDVNIMGLLHCTRQAMKLMKKNGHEAHIVNINSELGHVIPNIRGIPFNVYPATKYAVTAITESLINEISGDKIRVTSISPGLVKTEGVAAAQADGLLNIDVALQAEDVANSIVYAISVPQHVQVTELTIKPLGKLF